MAAYQLSTFRHTCDPKIRKAVLLLPERFWSIIMLIQVRALWYSIEPSAKRPFTPSIYMKSEK
jgi:hypothetical protein